MQKPHVKVISYSIENSGEPFVFRIDPIDAIQAENVDFNENESNLSIDEEGNLNISFDDDPTLILGSSDVSEFDQGFWLNDKDNITFSPAYQQDEEKSYAIRIQSGRTTFHVVTIIQDEEIIEADKDDLNIDKFNSKFDQVFGDKILSLDSPKSEMNAPSQITDIQKDQYNWKQRFYRLNNIENDGRIDSLLDLVDMIIDQEQDNLAAQGAKGRSTYQDDKNTLLSLPGLALATGRFSHARQILKKYAGNFEKGRTKDLTPDDLQKKLELQLWFVCIADSFVRYTGDYNFVNAHLWDSIQHNIHDILDKNDSNVIVGENGILSISKEKRKQIAHFNALWYNNLCIADKFAREFKMKNETYISLARKLKASFHRKFWNTGGEYIVDDLCNENDELIKPEHIFIVSLPYNILSNYKEKKMFSRIWKELYTPYGLKKLSSFDKKGIDSACAASGNNTKKTVLFFEDESWASFLGPFITSYVKTKHQSQKSRKFAHQTFLLPLLDHLHTIGFENLMKGSELDSSERPQKTQLVWNISEILRAYVEDIHGNARKGNIT